MDIDFDEELTFSEEMYDEIQNQSNEPWQCGLPNVGERVLALYGYGDFTDITITFPGIDITYDAHRLILAIASPVFEGILYGPMRTEGRNVELHDDDPLIMEYVIAYCYGVDLEPPDMDTALEVYKLADKYMLDMMKKDCCRHIVVDILVADNNEAILEFAEKFGFTDLVSNCLPYLKEMFEDTQDDHGPPDCYHDEPDNTAASTILMDLNDAWVAGLLSEVDIEVLDFHDSWKYPESPLIGNLSTILSSRRCELKKFYGCINVENVHLLPLNQIPDNNSLYSDPALELCLSVTDPYHASRIIQAINQQNRFEDNLIAIHIRCKGVWPRNWSPIPFWRTYRPSMLLISDADDDKASWVIEAAKALLPKSEGTYDKILRRYKDPDSTLYEVKPVTILKLPGSRFTPNGMINMLHGLSISGVKCKKILFQSPYISNEDMERINSSINTVEHMEFNPFLGRCLRTDHNFFRKVFEEFPHDDPDD